MSFFVEDSGKEFKRCPPGAHLARCYRIVDIGTQKTEYMGAVKHLHKVTFSWEIHAVDDDNNKLLMDDGRPFSIFKSYTLSWSEKANLRLDLQSWRGKPFSQEELRRFDLKNVLGAWCMLNIIERAGKDGKTYSNVGGVTPVPAMIKQGGLPEGVNKLELFNLQNPDMKMFETFSQGLKAKIEASPEWQKMRNQVPGIPQTPIEESDDDMPF